jgi:type IV secretion system protein VirB5
VVAAVHALGLKVLNIEKPQQEKPMSVQPFRYLIAVLIVCVVAVPRAQAQWAVVDVPATAQLIQEVATMEQAVKTAEAQLAQAKQTLATMTGGRGMELLLNGTSRNYLPTSWSQLTSVMQGGSGGFAILSNSVRSAVNANAVLSPQQLSTLSAADRQMIGAERQSSALQQALAGQALANASSRFAALQTLIGAISSASDQKGILDLQARISAEVAMLQNEQSKLLILNQATMAQQAVNHQQEVEQVIADQGRFETRFQPVP